MLRQLLILLVLFSSWVYADPAAWEQNYKKGIQLEAEGKYEEAASYFKMAVADKPISEIIPSGQGTLEYLPYLQLGLCYQQLGKNQLASEFLNLENRLPAIQQSAGGKELMAKVQQNLSDAGKSSAEQSDQAIRKYEKKPYLLSDVEVARMKEQIRQRCNLPKASDQSYPWYFHYELGKEMENKKDWQRALDSFLQALDHRDQPQKLSRMYGMWFVDYYPYYNIGVAHFHLQNWECAENAFELSQAFEDIPPTSQEFQALQKMKAEAQENIVPGVPKP